MYRLIVLLALLLNGLPAVADSHVELGAVVVVQGVNADGTWLAAATHIGAGYFLTNRHVADSSKVLTVTFLDGEKVIAQVVRMGKVDSDSALIHTTYIPDGLPALVIDKSAVEVDEEVVIIGHPGGFAWSWCQGRVQHPDRQDSIQFSGPSFGGISGGALIRASNHRLIGIGSRYIPGAGIDFAIKIAEMCRNVSCPTQAGADMGAQAPVTKEKASNGKD